MALAAPIIEIMGLPKKLQDTIQKTIAESEKDMF